VAASVSVFRGVFTFDSAKALFPEIKEDRLWQVMQELQRLGFLFFDEKQDRFDFHPIMRSFLYDSLTNQAEIHTLAVQYFQALPKEEKIVSLEDLAPVIELYHHLVKAGKFDEAFKLFNSRIDQPTYYQLAAYHLQIELLKELFPEGEDQLHRLEKEADQALALYAWAKSYSRNGQPAKAVPLYLLNLKLNEKNNDKKNLAIGLGAIAALARLSIGQLSTAAAHLRKRISICREIEDGLINEAIGHRELGRVLTYGFRAVETAKEFKRAFELAGKKDNIQNQGLTLAYRSLSALLQARLAAVGPGKKNVSAEHSLEALSLARVALEYAERTNCDDRFRTPPFRDFVRAYRLLGEALLQCRLTDGVNIETFNIHFYDEYFQKPVETSSFIKGGELGMAERCLNEALHRCHKTNMVDREPDILLAHARLEWAKISSQPKNKHPDSLPGVEKILQESHQISQRAGYRLNLADLHLFCGQVLVQLKEETTLLGLNAYDHLQKTKEYALDVSEFSDLYQSPDPDFYKGIPEYQMLKRGMTHEERIRNGYWVAYKIAEELEKRWISMISG
jgi:tetratricopeptide (TPR) repeat protein